MGKKDKGRQYKYPAILAACQESKSGKFTDEEFRTSAASLYRDPKQPPRNATEVTGWLRVPEYLEKKNMKPSEDLLRHCGNMNILQGGIANYFFIGALSVVAMRKELMEQIMVGEPPSYGYFPEQGLFACQFFKNGKWEEVIVDDYIPMSRDQPSYCVSPEPDVVWPMLMEKAYAKAHGTYEQSEGGSLSAALADLTGGLGEKIFFQDLTTFVKQTGGDKSAAEQEAEALDLLWKILTRNHENEFLMCMVLDDTTSSNKVNSDGIYLNHAYGILDVKEPKRGMRMIKFRSQWGDTTWTGKWHNGDESWTSDLKRQLNVAEESDKSTFWMELEDVMINFTKAVVSRFHELPGHKDNWTGVMRKGEWIKDVSAGGSTRNLLSWMDNPQYLLTVHENNSDVFIHLQQPDCDYINHEELNYKSIGFFVFKIPRAASSNLDPDEKKRKDTEGKAKILKASQDEVVAQTYLNPAREVSREIHGVSNGEQYIVLACTHSPNEEQKFILSIYATKTCDLSVHTLPDNHKQLIQWDVDTDDRAGGGIDGEHFCDNPAMKLKVLEKTCIKFFLQGEKLMDSSLCFYILNTKGGKAMKGAMSDDETMGGSLPRNAAADPTQRKVEQEDVVVLRENITYKNGIPAYVEAELEANTDSNPEYNLVFCSPNPARGTYTVLAYTDKPCVLLWDPDVDNDADVEGKMGVLTRLLNESSKKKKKKKEEDVNHTTHRTFFEDMFDTKRLKRKGCDVKACTVQ